MNIIKNKTMYLRDKKSKFNFNTENNRPIMLSAK